MKIMIYCLGQNFTHCSLKNCFFLKKKFHEIHVVIFWGLNLRGYFFAGLFVREINFRTTEQ